MVMVIEIWSGENKAWHLQDKQQAKSQYGIVIKHN